jgi:hypothetical protein
MWDFVQACFRCDHIWLVTSHVAVPTTLRDLTQAFFTLCILDTKYSDEVRVPSTLIAGPRN